MAKLSTSADVTAILQLDHPFWRKPVSGLSVGLRAILVLQRAGVRAVALSGAAATEILRQAERHPYSSLELTVSDDPLVPVDEGTLVIEEPSVFSSGAIEKLARQAQAGGAPVVASEADVGTDYFIAASTPSGLREAGRAIRRSCRKPVEFSGIMSVLFKQSIVLQVTRVVSRLPVTPNQVTVLSLLVGVLALPLYLEPTHAAVALGGLILFVNNLLDILDGQIARMKFLFTSYGEKLDNLADGLLNALLLAPVGIGLHGRSGEIAFEILGWAGSIGAAAYLLIIEYYVFRQRHSGYTTGLMFWYRLDRDGNPKSSSVQKAPARPKTGIRRYLVAKYVLRKDFLFTLFLIFGLLDLHVVPFCLMAAGYIQYGSTALIQFIFFHSRIRFVGSHKGSG